MATTRPSPQRRRPRRGTLERPVNARLYRGTWLLVGLPLLVAAFSVARPAALAPPALPPAFDERAATSLARELAKTYPDRSPGSIGAAGAATWLIKQMTPFNLPIQTDRFKATIPGIGSRSMENIAAIVNGQSPDTIIVMAHRDDTVNGPGANDNASGTAALIELARTYAAAQTGTSTARPVAATHRIVFLSTDGGRFGGLGARHFVTHSPIAPHVVAVVNLDAIGAARAARIELAGDYPRSPAAALIRTAADRLTDQAGAAPSHPGGLAQLIDLGFPFSLYEQSPFVGRGIPAITITTSANQPNPAFIDRPGSLDAHQIGVVGRATQDLLGSLDAGLELTQGTTAYVWLGDRLIRGWAIELVLIAALLPFLAAAVDLFARTRRLHVRLRPAFRALRSRVAFWLFAGLLFWLFGLLGAWPDGAAAPIAPDTPAARDWPVVALCAFGAVLFATWLIARPRFAPRRPITPEETLAGHTAALLYLGVVALIVVAINPFALLLLLPSLHAWLWLPQVRDSVVSRIALLTVGLAGAALVLWSFGHRFGLGFDAPWYLTALVAVGYIKLPQVVLFLLWAAAGTQLAALAAGRYVAYPDERLRGPIRQAVRSIARTARQRRRD